MVQFPAENFYRIHWIHRGPMFTYFYCVYKKQLSVDILQHAIHTWCTMKWFTEFLSCMNFLGIPGNSLYRESFLHIIHWQISHLHEFSDVQWTAFIGFLSCMSPLICTENWFLREGFFHTHCINRVSPLNESSDVQWA